MVTTSTFTVDAITPVAITVTVKCRRATIRENGAATVEFDIRGPLSTATGVRYPIGEKRVFECQRGESFYEVATVLAWVILPSGSASFALEQE